MIMDLRHFIKKEEPYWRELEEFLQKNENDLTAHLSLTDLRRFHYLILRVGSAFQRLETFSQETEVHLHLQNLVARAHRILHSREAVQHSWSFKKWFFEQVPQAFRLRFKYFICSLLSTLLGASVGIFLLASDVRSRDVIFPFEHLLNSPKERVQEEESRIKDHPVDKKRGEFAGHLMTHNIQVSLVTLGMGMLWGIGSFILLFYNGVILGAVCYDYLHHGLGVFLTGWLLPHGIIEIPAILIAGQAGFLLGHAMIGYGTGQSFRSRITAVQQDVIHFSGLLAIMLVWAGIIEAFFSQYHEPIIPYSLKISFGIIEGIALISYLSFSGRKK